MNIRSRGTIRSSSQHLKFVVSNVSLSSSGDNINNSTHELCLLLKLS